MLLLRIIGGYGYSSIILVHNSVQRLLTLGLDVRYKLKGDMTRVIVMLIYTTFLNKIRTLRLLVIKEILKYFPGRMGYGYFHFILANIVCTEKRF